MATYRVSWRESTQEWTVKKSGRVIRTFQTKDPAKRAAAQFADGPEDRVIFENKNGSIGRTFENPRP